MPYTLKEVADFCHTHQRRRSPKGKVIYRDQAEWNRIVISASKMNTLYTVENPEQQRLIGVAIAKEYPFKRVLWVSEIVCISNAFSTFVREVYKHFPVDYKVTGNRFGKQRTYTKDNLYGRRPS